MISSRNRRQIVLDNDPIIPIIGHANDAVQLGLFTGIFSALTQAMTGPARFFVLPAALATEMTRGVLALHNWFNAVNRNFSKTSKAVLETVKFLAIGLALLGSLIGVLSIVAIAPLLFVAAIGTNVLYHGVKSLFHAYKWVIEKGEEGKKYHAKEFKHSLMAATTGIISGLAMTFLLIVAPPIGIIASIAAYTAAAVSGISALWSGYQSLVSYQNRDVNKTDEKVEGLADPLLHNEAKDNTLAFQPHPLLVHSPIHYLPKLKAYHDDLIKEVLNGPRPQHELVGLLQSKIGVLEDQLKENSFFQQSKRMLKMEFLKHLHTLVTGHVVTITDRVNETTLASPAELLAFVKTKGDLNDVFNSFCAEVGEVQKLFLLADGYFEKTQPEMSYVPAPAMERAAPLTMTMSR